MAAPAREQQRGTQPRERDRARFGDGRDHHAPGFTCLLAGGGVRGGQVWGATDEIGSKVIENGVSIPDFNATIAYALGIPLDTVLYSPSKRPFTVSDKGRPVTQLFG